MNYAKGIAPLESGGKTEWDNGNGSLMRILPVCLYLFKRQKKVCTSENESIYMIHAVSALTHAHVRSQIACGIYYFLVKAILEEEGSLEKRLQKGMDRGSTAGRMMHLSCLMPKDDIRNLEKSL